MSKKVALKGIMVSALLICIILVGSIILSLANQNPNWTIIDHPELKSEQYLTEISDGHHTSIFCEKDVYQSFIEDLNDGITLGFEVMNHDENEKLFKTKSYLKRELLEVVLTKQILKVNSEELQIWTVSKYRYIKPKNEKQFLAELWGEALKARDGKSRFKIMSQEMKNNFVIEQKRRANEDGKWYYNIGSSSPSVSDFELTVKDHTASISYDLYDSTPSSYNQTETITFGVENDKIVVTSSEYSLEEWERVSRLTSTAEQAMEAYKQALLDSDYMKLLSLTHNEEFNSKGQKIWDTVKIKDVKAVSQEIRDCKACYQLELDIADSGSPDFKTGVSSYWLYLIKDSKLKNGWYVEGLRAEGPPDEEWWTRQK